MNDEHCNAQIHQSKRDRMPGATGADLHDGCAFRALPAETLLDNATPSAPLVVIRAVTEGCRDCDSIDVTDLRGFGMSHIEKRQDVLLKRVRDVGPREPGSFDRIKKLRQPTLAQAIDVD